MSDGPNQHPTPFILWTLRRTGGTNLAAFLFGRSPLENLPHEPLNYDRVLGHISRAWVADRDARALSGALDAALSGQVLIKHCVETVPPPVSEALADIGVARGYRHVFLVRRSALDRLLSLHFAQSFDIWGPDHARKADGDEIARRVAKSGIPIDALLDREQNDRVLFAAIYDRLRAGGGALLHKSPEGIHVVTPA